ncbi:MAG: ubiquinol-cytochrome C chaperone [Alphaproteobacteria bacterium]|nr:ubiquinol-cytochrome C chaperone [Alphaproteobacteria bacterium]
MLNLLRKSIARKREGARLYEVMVARARDPVFYREFGVADSIDGRFDLVVLHAWLVLSALKAAGEGEAAQGLTDAIFIGFDEAMREQGAGDMGLSRKMKAFADAFFGRVTAYESAGDATALAEALARNLYRGGPVDGRSRALAAYALAAGPYLKAAIPRGLDFGPLPTISVS